MAEYPSPVGLGGFLLFGLDLQHQNIAAIAQRVGGLTQSATGSEVFSAAITQRVGGLRQSATGSEVFSAAITQQLAPLRQAAVAYLTGTQYPSPVGLGGFLLFGIVPKPIPASNLIAQRVGGLRQSATGSEVFSGAIAQRLGGLVQ